MKKRNNIILLSIISIILIGGIIATIFFVTQQTALESGRGQIPYLDFNDNVYPCAKFNYGCHYYNDYTCSEPLYRDFKLQHSDSKCIEAYRCSEGGCSSPSTVQNGEYKLNSNGNLWTILTLNNILSNSDTSIYYTLNTGKICSTSSCSPSTVKVSTNFGGEDSLTGLDSSKQGVIKITHTFLDINTIEINIAGRVTTKKLDNLNSNLELTLIGQSGNIAIDEIRYSIPLTGTCQIKEGQVLVFDDFKMGSNISWESLTYEPSSFCYDEPARKVNIGKGIIYDKNAELTYLISQGGSKVVDDADFYRIPYITEFVTGMPPSCPVGFAINTKTKSCEQVVEEKPIIQQCSAIKDCPLPASCESERNNIKCENNVCIGYESIQCKNEVLVIQRIKEFEKITEIQPMLVGESTLTYTFDVADSMRKIGNETLYVNKLDDDSIQIDFIGKRLINKGIINDYLTIACQLSGSYKNDVLQSNYKIICSMDIKPFVKSISTENKFNYELNEELNYHFCFNNLLPISFDTSSLSIVCSRQMGLQESLNTVLKGHSLADGNTCVNLVLPYKEIGTYVCDAKDTITLNDDTGTKNIYATQDKALFTFNIGKTAQPIDEVPSIILPVEPPMKPITATPSYLKDNPFLIILGIFLVIIVMIGILTLITSHKKRYKHR